MSLISGTFGTGDRAGLTPDLQAPWTAVSDCGGRHAAVCGRIRWTDRDLAEISAENPARAVISAQEKYGDDFLSIAAGPFAVALIDTSRASLVLAIDRFGVESMYWARSDGLIHFSSTAAYVLRSLPNMPRINDQSVFNFLYFHCVPSPGTMWHGVQKLQPAERLSVLTDRPTLSKYWIPDFSRPKPRGTRELIDNLHVAMRDAVRWDMTGSLPGAFLSGGLDSSTVCGVLKDLSDGEVKAFSVGFSDEAYNELEYAKIAADRFALDHHAIQATTHDTEAALDDIFAAYEEPFGNSSIVPTYLCARAAADSGVDTLLAGDAGDELFAGNSRYATQKLFEQYARMPGALRKLLEPLFLRTLSGVNFMPVRKVRRFIEQAIVPLPMRLESHNHLEHWPYEKIFDAEFLSGIDTGVPSAMLYDRYQEPNNADFMDRMLYLDWKFTLADNDLRKVTKMCALAGIDVRFPFLDERVVDLSIEVPSASKIRLLRLRHFYKQAMQDFLPKSIIDKPKHGFGLPFGEWLKTSTSLQHRIYGLLRDLGKRGLVRRAFIEQLIESHRDGHAAYYGNAVWVFMSLEMWFRRAEAAGQADRNTAASLAAR